MSARLKWSLLLVIVLGACQARPAPADEQTQVVGDQSVRLPAAEQATVELTVIDIPLSGPMAERNAEISGMAWYGDHLILLPQYPDFNGRDSALFALSRDTIEAYLDGEQNGPLLPTEIPFRDEGVPDDIRGFEGYEALGFDGESVYLTIEASGGGMRGYLVQGQLAPDLSELVVQREPIMPIEPQSDRGNKAEEALLVAGDEIITLYETNGPSFNENPVAHRFDRALRDIGTLPFSNIPYRITDATALDGNGRFWVINYNFPGDNESEPDKLTATYGEGETHRENEGVERLVQFQVDDIGISLVQEAPLQLKLLPDALRNWEGIARLDERGFLLVTDKFPDTRLGFVARP